MTAEERAAARNGIWLCCDHAKIIDSDTTEFTVDQLRDWKRSAEVEAWALVTRHERHEPGAKPHDRSFNQLRSAAARDLEAYRRTTKWASTPVELTVWHSGLKKNLSTSDIAAAGLLDDFILVAPPGVGKTTAMFQIADRMVASEPFAPILVSLGDWATQKRSIIDWVFSRPAFQGIVENAFHEAASSNGVVLLLDGWNELGVGTRDAARVQVEALKAGLPLLRLVITTRPQSRDVPFEGTHLQIQPLSENQQSDIAIRLRGEEGPLLLDTAWRTDGIRDLVSIPLYLVTLLGLPVGGPFPSTKEEVLRRFVEAHNRRPELVEHLDQTLEGLHQHYLEALATRLTSLGASALSDYDARQVVSLASQRLIHERQLSTQPKLLEVLQALTRCHVLITAIGFDGYSFQHQQFQEWYASHEVERAIAAGAPGEALRAILNHRPWEESVLFAVERLARGTARQQTACGEAILAALHVDPLLAADMVYRSSNGVWQGIAEDVLRFVHSWHAPGKADRAVRFMITTGRPDFVDVVWPLVANEDDQLSFQAVRNCDRFRLSVLGDGASKLKSLSSKARKRVVSDIASYCGVQDLAVVASLAKQEAEPEIRSAIVNALSFRRADFHVDAILRTSDDEVLELVAKDAVVESVSDEVVKARLEAVRARLRDATNMSFYALRAIMFGPDNIDKSVELQNLLDANDSIWTDHAHLIADAWRRYPRVVGEAVLRRVRSGKEPFYGAAELLRESGFVMDDDWLVEIVLNTLPERDLRANVAASVLGARSVTKVLDELVKLLRAGKADLQRETRESARELETRLTFTPLTSLIAALDLRWSHATHEQIELYVELITRHWRFDRSPSISADMRREIQKVVLRQGKQVLETSPANRRQLEVIARLAAKVPSSNLLPTLEKLLDQSLGVFARIRAEAIAANWGQSGEEIAPDVRQPMLHGFREAFMAIDGNATVSLMDKYLMNSHFGEHAAAVLLDGWRRRNEALGSRHFGAVDYSAIESRRAMRRANADATCDEAEMLLAAITILLGEELTEENRHHVIALAISWLRLPHGRHENLVERIFDFASQRTYPSLLLSQVLAGEVVEFRRISAGVSSEIEKAIENPWRFAGNDGYRLFEWIRLLPFSDAAVESLALINRLPDPLCAPDVLWGMLDALEHAERDIAEQWLFTLANRDATYFYDHRWLNALSRIDSDSATKRLIDILAAGRIGSYRDRWSLGRSLGGLLEGHPKVRPAVYHLLATLDDGPPLDTLAHAVGEQPDHEGLLALVALETRLRKPRIGFRTVELVVTQQVPSQSWEGAFEIVPKAATELRRNLLLLSDPIEPSDASARCLEAIDNIRDQYGTPEFEPRHPSLASGKTWPRRLH